MKKEWELHIDILRQRYKNLVCFMWYWGVWPSKLKLTWNWSSPIFSKKKQIFVFSWFCPSEMD